MPAKRTGPERFSDRVENYVRYRPDYPPTVIDVLQREIGLTPTWVIADVGAGTGLSSQLFLENGNEVYGVEPNLPMRMAAQHYLAGYQGYHSVAGTAEATTLAAASVHCVVAAQAFHWFDVAAARVEAQRILRPNGWAVLLWNTRRSAGTPLLEAYELLLTDFGTDYQEVRHDNADATRLAAYFDGEYSRTAIPHQQQLDLDGFRGRLASSSYLPAQGDPRFDELMSAAEGVFAEHETDGRAVIEYDTEIYWGRMA
jgi:SAM-dependent methyltransferase